MTEPRPIDGRMLRGCAPPRLEDDDDKQDRGVLLVLAGGREAPGAALLAGVAGLRVGAGKLQIAAPRTVATALALAVPEARVFAAPERDGEIDVSAADALAVQVERADAVVIGPGMLDPDLAGALAVALLRRRPRAHVVVDAAALTGLRGPIARGDVPGGQVVATPNAGEMAQLAKRSKADVEADPLGAARDVGAALQAVIVMKGAETQIVLPDGAAWTHRGGLPGLGVSGSGDVLAGAIGGLLARGASPLGAAAWGVVLHNRAGRALADRIGPVGFLARELLDELPRQLAALGEEAQD